MRTKNLALELSNDSNTTNKECNIRDVISQAKEIGRKYSPRSNKNIKSSHRINALYDIPRIVKLTQPTNKTSHLPNSCHATRAPENVLQIRALQSF